MENNAMYSDNLNEREAKVELELSSALLQAEGVTCSWDGNQPLTEESIAVSEDPHAIIAYPWNVLDQKSEAFFATPEGNAIFEDWQELEIAERSGAFFSGLHDLWSAAALQDTLLQKFALRMPQSLVTAIAQCTKQVAASSLSLSEQLMQSTQAVLPWLTGWTLEDLGVQARPFAYAMRAPNTQVVDSVRVADWQDLSDVEKAKLSLIVASYALTELKVDEQA